MILRQLGPIDLVQKVRFTFAGVSIAPEVLLESLYWKAVSL
jgi:hypothetical protein